MENKGGIYIMQREKAKAQLKKLIYKESIWIQKLCYQLIDEAAAPNMWDDIIYENIRDKKASRSHCIIKKCDEGFYQDIAEHAYEGIDIEDLIAESVDNIIATIDSIDSETSTQ